MNKIFEFNQRLILGCVAILLCLLPIYTPITTYLINIHGFPFWIVLWKEAVSIILLGALLVDGVKIIADSPKKNLQKLAFKLWPVLLFVTLTIYILLLSVINNTLKDSIIYGFRFELWWVVIMAMILSWKMLLDTVKKNEFLSTLFKVFEVSVYCGFVISAVFALGIYVSGQTQALINLGYGTYVGEGAYLNPVICHPIDAFVDQCRLSGGFTLPNHYAGYLLMVLGFFMYKLFSNKDNLKIGGIFALVSLATIVLIFLTYTRFALLGLGVILGWAAFGTILETVNKYKITAKFRNQFGAIVVLLQKSALALLILIPMAIGIIGINISSDQISWLPVFLSKPNSTSEHYRRTMANLEVIQADPAKALIGYGIGTSGPAAKPEYADVTQNPIYKKYLAVAYSPKWYVGYGIFVPENWYIQLLLNGGIGYALGYTFLVGFLVWTLFIKVLRSKDEDELRIMINRPVNYIVLGMFTIMLGNLFLHIWENQTLALYYALLAVYCGKIKD